MYILEKINTETLHCALFLLFCSFFFLVVAFLNVFVETMANVIYYL